LEVINTLSHPAILKGLGSGKYNRIPYLVTEFVDGRSLRTIIDEDAPISPEQAIPLIRKIAEGMAYCHANNVVHRDLKPENILVTSEGQPVIMDFGLALTKGSHRVTYSNLSATMGTPDYMAPEQIEGQRGDQRTDVYALGTILYEMLSGKTPFTGDTNMVVMAQHLQKDAPRLDRINTAISPQLAAVVSKCLARDPNERYPEMLEFIKGLDHPETADLGILDKLNPPSVGGSFWQSQAVRGVAIALAILAGLTILALFLQALHK
jgi:serine/threonine-protein kinase